MVHKRFRNANGTGGFYRLLTKEYTMTEYVGPIEKQTLGNNFFRKVLFTGKYNQLVVMCLQ